MTRAAQHNDDWEEPIELRRYVDALRRSRSLIATIVIVMTVTAAVASLALPKMYRASAKILFDPAQSPAAPQTSDAIQRQLATISSLVLTQPVLNRVAARYRMTPRALSRQVGATADQSTYIIHVSGTARNPGTAASIANDIARTFIAVNAAADRTSIRGARAKVLAQISSLGATQNSSLELQSLKTRLSDLALAFANTGSELQLAEPAQPPSSPASPRLVLATLVAFFASSLFAILIAIGREQLVPRVTGTRELTRITDLPVLATVPFIRRRLGRQPRVLEAPEHEAYEAMQATIGFQLRNASGPRVILLTSGVPGEGKTSVCAYLGRALARAGFSTLAISADMRHPKLHEHLNVPEAPGLSELLTTLEHANGLDRLEERQALASVDRVIATNSRLKGKLHVLPSGVRPPNPGRLLQSRGMDLLLDQIQRTDHQYVLIDGTPLIGLVDAQALARRVDSVIVVARLDRVSLDDVIKVRDLLDQIEVTPLGYVVIGGPPPAWYRYSEPSTDEEQDEARQRHR